MCGHVLLLLSFSRADLVFCSCADLSSDLAECAIERFAEANFSRINNKSGFLMV